MSTVTVVAKVVANEGAVASVKAELLKLIEPTRNEKGCIEYRLHQDNDDQRVFIFFEIWEDMDSLKDHAASQHYKSYVAAVEGMVAEKAVHKMTCIA